MKGSECKFVKFMAGDDKRFVIPVYQRNYDWKMEQCKQLYDDLVKIVHSGKKNHFFGSIVSVYDPDSYNEEYLIIDGQQRLTTVSLLFLAMYNLLNEGILTAQSDNLKQKIYETYLVDKWQPKDTRIKLKPVKNDRSAFEKLFGAQDEYIHESNLTVNYDYFYNRIQKQEITIDQLNEAICRLEIINVKLDGDDDPQMIFESLNSTGLDLSEGDKIRNFILMGQPVKEQELYYDKYWNVIEKCTDYDVSAFIRDYLSIKQQAIPSQKKIYVNFKEYVETSEAKVEPLLAELLAYAKRYRILLRGETKNTALDACIYRLNRLETTVTRPFFLEVLRLYDEANLEKEQVADVFLTTENYLFRRTICDLPTNALNKIFLLRHREIVRYDGTEENYVEKFKYALCSKKERARFPDDEEFAARFAERQIYLMNNKNKVYILERLENFDTAEDKDIYRRCDDGIYTIEHIMPQHLTPIWQRELGENYAQIHEEWLHRIANLTLTAYNSQYSNSPFQEKKTMPHGFWKTGIRLNMDIAQNERWTLTELEERSRSLTKQALAIWTRPKTSFEPKEKQLDFYTLDDDVDLTGRQILKFAFRSTEQPVESWAEMLQKVLQILYEEDPSAFQKLAVSQEDDGVAQNFSTKPFANGVIISGGIHVKTGTNTQTKLTLLKRIFKLCDIDPADLVFYLRDEAEPAADEPSSRHEVRRKYWSYALPVIKKAHGGNGSFSNVTTSKENWINGSFGVQGFSLCCVANYNAARVELYLGKASKDTNKRVFDELFLHREEIETKLCTHLVWNRGDNVKSSKVFIELPGVSIEKEVDWLQMARFHAEWSKKFYDVIVPYLTK